MRICGKTFRRVQRIKVIILTITGIFCMGIFLLLL